MDTFRPFVVFLLFILPFVYGVCPDLDAQLVSYAGTIGSTQTVTITNKVKLDGDFDVNSITIDGTLVFDDSKDVSLRFRYMRINPGGSLIIGSESCPYQHKAIVTMKGLRSNVSEAGIDPLDAIPLGTKGVAVTSGSTIELHGNINLPSWTRLSQTAIAGATQLVLEKVVTWKAGDLIAIANTDFSAAGSNNEVPEQSEKAVIQSVSGNTITLAAPLKYMHWGSGYEKAEVGLLTRNIVFQGDDLSEQDGFGGHLIIRKVSAGHIEGVEFTRMGQVGILGRYPVHWHLLKDQIGNGFYTRHNSIHDNYQRCIAIHDTNGLLVQNNVAFNTTGHCYFFEDGGEIKNTMEGNLGILARKGTLILSDDDPAIFWITNPDNIIRGNAAVGGNFGYWYSLPDHPVGASVSAYQNSQWIWPSKTPLLEFSDNVAHSQGRNGLMVDEMVQPDETTPLGDYSPKEGPYNTTFYDYQYIPHQAIFRNTLAYKCREHGIWTRGSNLITTGSVLLDNTNGILMVPGPILVENTYIEGETDNIGTPFSYWLPDMPRSRPVYWTNSIPVLGLGNYDAGGPQFYRNVTMKNFQTNTFRPSGGLFILPNGINILQPSNKYFDIKFINTNPVYLEDFPNSYSSALLLDGPKGVNINDLDGSVTGTPGAWVVSKSQIMLKPECQLQAAWNAYICPPTLEAYVQITINNLNTGGTNFGTSVTNKDYIRASWYSLGSSTSNRLDVTGGDMDSFTRNRYTANLISRNAYTIRFNHPTPPQLELAMYGAPLGAWVIVAIPYPSSTTFTLTTGYSNIQLNSVDAVTKVDKWNYFYDQSTQHLYVYIINDDDQTVSEFPDPKKDVYGRFSFHDSYGASVTITTTCGTACTVGTPALGASPSPAIPVAITDTEDKFQAKLLGVSCTSTESGTVLFAYNSNSHVLTYTIYHTIGRLVANNATIATLNFGTSGVGTVQLQLNNALSPIRGSLTMSRDKHLKLWNGQLMVNIGSTAFGGGEIRGQIGCSSASCSVPKQIVEGDFCTYTAITNYLLYNDQLTGWSSWSWGTNFVANFSSTDTLCGTKSIWVNYNGSSSLSLHNNANGLSIDTSIYKYFQFFIKAVGGVIDLEISIDSYTPVRTNFNHIANYAIEDSWTRVRIPLSEFGMTGTSTAVRIDIQQFESWRAPPRQTYFDEIRFVAQSTDTLSAPITGTASPYLVPTDPCIVRGTTSSTSSSTALTSSSASSAGTSSAVSTGSSGATSSASTSTASSSGVTSASTNDIAADQVRSAGNDGDGSSMIIIGSSAAAGILLLLIVITIVLLRKRSKSRNYNKSPISHQNSSGLISPVPIIPMVDIQTSMMKTAWDTNGAPPTTVRPPPPPANNNFRIGMMCQAKFSGDGAYYRARIDDCQGGQYLVNYVDFGGSTEWLPVSSMKPY